MGYKSKQNTHADAITVSKILICYACSKGAIFLHSCVKFLNKYLSQNPACRRIFEYSNTKVVCESFWILKYLKCNNAH